MVSIFPPFSNHSSNQGNRDTVSSVGLVRNKTLPMTTDGMTHVSHFRHALALDERRVKFLPEYAYGGVTEKPQSEEQSVKSRSKPSQTKETEKTPAQANTSEPTTPAPQLDAPKGDVKEVWFAGTHSDM
jgi:uncharacterized protein (DUF2235 family)